MTPEEKNATALLEKEEVQEATAEEVEAPEAYEEIMIEEINIDGMCGVY